MSKIFIPTILWEHFKEFMEMPTICCVLALATFRLIFQVFTLKENNFHSLISS